MKWRALALIIQASRTPGHVTPVQPEYWEKPVVHPAGESLYRTGMGNAYSCIPWSGYEYGHSAHFPNPRP